MELGESHIVLVNSSMSCGGAERVTGILANAWVSMGLRVTIVTIHSAEGDFFRLDPRVGRRSLNMSSQSDSLLGSVASNLKRVSALRRQLKSLKPSVIVSFQDQNNVLTLLANIGLRVPVIVSERNDPRMRSIPRPWSVLRSISYKWADALVLQTNSLREWGEQLVRGERIEVFPNPVLPQARDNEASGQESMTIVAAGRLVHQKGFDLLLQSLTLCKKKWKLKVLGEGPERSKLEALTRDLSLDDQVEFVGQTSNPAKVFSSSALFVLSSRWEGFPNVLLEAMACGLPAVSFDCRSGPSEIIRDGVDGTLVKDGDVSGLARAIDALMLDESTRSNYSRRAVDVLERFSVDKILNQWLKLISRVAKAGA